MTIATPIVKAEVRAMQKARDTIVDSETGRSFPDRDVRARAVLKGMKVSIEGQFVVVRWGGKRALKAPIPPGHRLVFDARVELATRAVLQGALYQVFLRDVITDGP